MVHGPLQPLVAPRRASVRSRAPRAHSFLSDSAGGPSNGDNDAVRFDRKIVHRSIHVQPLANAAREPANQASQRRRRPRTRLRPSAPTAVQLGSLTDTPSATSPRWLSCSGGPEGARCTKRHSAPTDENKNDDPASKTAIPRLRPHSSALCHRITHVCPDPLPIRVGDAKDETSDRRLQRAPPRIPGRSNRGLSC